MVEALVQSSTTCPPSVCYYYYHSHPIHENDVICGKKCEKHPGNVAFRRIVMEYRNRYQATSHRDRKKQIIEEVIQRVRATGGHFLKESPDQQSMEVVPSSYVYEKVSHALRSTSSSSSSIRSSGGGGDSSGCCSNHHKDKSAIADDDTLGIFDNLLALQQRFFYSYLMAAATTTTTSSDACTTDDDIVDDDDEEDHTTVITNVSSSSDEDNQRTAVQLSRKHSFCDIVDQTTINILLNLHEV